MSIFIKLLNVELLRFNYVYVPSRVLNTYSVANYCNCFCYTIKKISLMQKAKHRIYCALAPETKIGKVSRFLWFYSSYDAIHFWAAEHKAVIFFFSFYIQSSTRNLFPLCQWGASKTTNKFNCFRCLWQ